MTDFLQKFAEKLSPDNLRSDHSKVFKGFSAGLENWSLTGIEPKEADQDVQYFMDLQHKRIMEHGLDYQVNFVTDDQVLSTEKFIQNWKILGSLDAVKFNQSQHYQLGILEVAYKRDDRPIFRKKNDATFFQTILEPADATEDLEELDYVCDNCGYVTKIGQLVEACPSCGTHYDLGGFYPRVSNFWFTPNLGQHENNKRNQILKWAFILGFLIMNIISILTGQWGIGSIFGSLFFGLIVLVVVFFISTLLLMAKVTKEAASSVSLARQSKGTRSKTTEFLREFDPAFSFDYFEHKSLALLRMILFHPDYTKIPQFIGHSLPNKSEDILDIQYRGGISLDSFQEKEGLIQANIGIYVLASYYEKGKIKQEKEVFQVEMIHKTGFLANPGFSIKKITCKHCGGSFDASREAACPYCFNDYDLSEEDWLVRSIERASK